MTETATHRSVSQFSSFTRCSEGYRLEKVARAPQSPAAWFHQGSAFHKAAEFWELSLRKANLDIVLECYYQEYDRLVAKDLERQPDLSKWLTGGRTKAADDIARRRDRGADQVKGYMTYALTAPERVFVIGDSPAVEVEFELDLDGIRVIGFIDQIVLWPDGRITARDLKTGTKRPDWPFQLGVYDIAIEEMFGYRPYWGDFYIAKDNKPDPMVDLSTFTRAKVTRWFQDMDRSVNSGLFVPNVGDACRVCTVSDFCSAIGPRADEYPPLPLEVLSV